MQIRDVILVQDRCIALGLKYKRSGEGIEIEDEPFEDVNEAMEFLNNWAMCEYEYGRPKMDEEECGDECEE